MDMNNPYQLPNDHYSSGGGIRAYSFIPINAVDNLLHNHPDLITQSMRHYYPLPYPYTWYVSGDHAVIVHVHDLFEYENGRPFSPSSSNQQLNEPYDQVHSETVDEVMILQDHNMNHGTLEQSEGFEQSDDQVQHPYELSEITDEDVAMLDDFIMDESFERAANLIACSGLTKKVISKNLRLVRYKEEEDGEICVVCQAEFEKNERVGVLQCKHRYHPKCIEEWLLRQNVCPLCKGQGLIV